MPRGARAAEFARTRKGGPCTMARRKDMLTEKQEKFARNMALKNMSQRAAYRDAYPSSQNWPDATVDVSACKLFKNTKVRLMYDRLKNELREAAEADGIVDAKKVIAEIAKIAFSDRTEAQEIKNMRMSDGKIHPCIVTKSTKKMSEGTRASIAEIREGQNGIEIKSYDKLKALELLGRSIGIFVDKNEMKLDGEITQMTYEQKMKRLMELREKQEAASALHRCDGEEEER